MKEYTINDVTRVVKKALSVKYGSKNVSVTHGRGTAYGWITAEITFGIPMQNLMDRRSIASEAYSLAKEALKTAGLKFNTYYSDVSDVENNQFTIIVK